MGFAKYFEKNLVSLNRINSNFNNAKVRNLLSNYCINIFFDSQAATTFEGRIGLELIVRQLSRFYPYMKIVAIEKGNDIVLGKMQQLALQINKNLEFSERKYAINICLTKTLVEEPSNTFYIGSNNWIGILDEDKPIGFNTSKNPIGASIAACLATRQTFLHVLSKTFEKNLQRRIFFNGFSFESFVAKKTNPKLKPIDIENTTLVGAGAIGNATTWILAKCEQFSGNLLLIDDEDLDESNLQRYIAFTEDHINQSKVKILSEYFTSDSIKPIPKHMSWQKWMHENNQDLSFLNLVGVGVDTKQLRIEIQSALPKMILNAYTDDNRFGITRHYNFSNAPCLACLYIPEGQEKSKLEKMQEELNMPGEANLKLIHNYMSPKRVLDEHFLSEYAKCNGLKLSELHAYKGQHFSQMYSEFICGNKLIQLKGKNQSDFERADVPLVFQSCWAGIQLAAEIIKERGGYNQKLEISTTSQIQIINRIDEDNPLNMNYSKILGQRCICGDPIYLERYCSKWNILN